MFGELFKLSDMANHGNATAKVALEFFNQEQDSLKYKGPYDVSTAVQLAEQVASTMKLFFMSRMASFCMEHQQEPTEFTITFEVKPN